MFSVAVDVAVAVSGDAVCSFGAVAVAVDSDHCS